MKHVLFAAAVLLALFMFVPAAPPKAQSPVSSALVSASQGERDKLASVYRAIADITERDAGTLIGTVATWRSLHSNTLALAFGNTNLKGKYPQLAPAIEEVLSKYFPLDNAAMTDDLVRSIAAGCREVERTSGGR